MKRCEDMYKYGAQNWEENSF